MGFFLCYKEQIMNLKKQLQNEPIFVRKCRHVKEGFSKEIALTWKMGELYRYYQGEDKAFVMALKRKRSPDNLKEYRCD